MHDAPLIDKGTAFTHDERARLGIEGRLPPRVETLGEQAARVMSRLEALPGGLDRYVHLRAVQDQNETLFYRVLVDHLESLLPVVYTPTVGRACQEWSRIYARPRGLYLSARHRGRIAGLLGQWPQRDIRIIVVTDGGRILGLGDLGANGMGIPIGKLALYTACASVPPSQGLPVTIDVGTDNESLRRDPLYLGEREPRLKGEAWDSLLDEFIDAAARRFPRAVIQFEDFNNGAAFALLRRHRDRVRCFNDDIQGTGAMGLAGIVSAGRVTGRALVDQRILFAGAGEACLGIGMAVVAALRRAGLPEAEARRRCLYFDSQGLVVASRPGLAAHKRPYAQDCPPAGDLVGAIEAFRPTALVGASGQGGLFTREVLAAMARVAERPVVFALSNPTERAECTAEQAYAATAGRAVFASGSPFAPVTLDGRELLTGQANNATVFPGVGLGLLVSGASRVSDEMFLGAADALAACVTDAELARGCVFPRGARLREVAAAVAVAVAKVAWEQGLAAGPLPQDLAAAVAAAMYEPVYCA